MMSSAGSLELAVGSGLTLTSLAENPPQGFLQREDEEDLDDENNEQQDAEKAQYSRKEPGVVFSHGCAALG
jgi:hypothetical protein